MDCFSLWAHWLFFGPSRVDYKLFNCARWSRFYKQEADSYWRTEWKPSCFLASVSSNLRYNESSTIVLLLLSLLKTRRLSTFSGTNVKLLPRIHPVSEPGTFLVSQSSSWRSPGSPRAYRKRPYTTFLLLVSHRTWVSLEHECIPNSFRGLESQKAD